jgi:nucleotide-binding universal stress UspA family protein
VAHKRASHPTMVPPELAPYRQSDQTLLLPPHSTPVLLAIAHDDAADSAIRVTHELVMRRNAAPTVLQVFDPTPYAPPSMLPSMMTLAETLIGPAATDERRQQIEAWLARVCGHAVTWPIVSRLGNPTTCIADEAHKRHSELIVLGLHHHDAVDHLLGQETTFHVFTNAGIPVLGIAHGAHTMPHRILVGVDFSRASINTAQLAARLLEPPGELLLAHVQLPAPPVTSEDAEGGQTIHEEGINAAFAKLMQVIPKTPGVLVRRVLLTGDPATALLSYAEIAKPDLIAVASQQHARVRRLLIGTVSRQIIRDGRWSVFVTPPA